MLATEPIDVTLVLPSSAAVKQLAHRPPPPKRALMQASTHARIFSLDEPTAIDSDFTTPQRARPRRTTPQRARQQRRTALRAARCMHRPAGSGTGRGGEDGSFVPDGARAFGAVRGGRSLAGPLGYGSDRLFLSGAPGRSVLHLVRSLLSFIRWVRGPCGMRLSACMWWTGAGPRGSLRSLRWAYYHIARAAGSSSPTIGKNLGLGACASALHFVCSLPAHGRSPFVECREISGSLPTRRARGAGRFDHIPIFPPRTASLSIEVWSPSANLAADSPLLRSRKKLKHLISVLRALNVAKESGLV